MTDPQRTLAAQRPLHRFVREGTRHRFTARTATVRRSFRPVPGIVRVTLSGPDFHDFSSTGPADHVRIYFPDPGSGLLIAPTPTEEGIARPSGPAISRDYTPINVRTDEETGTTAFDVDFVLHENPGPATLWASGAISGDTVVVVGPKGSRRAPQDAEGLLLICDETALPSASRWIRDAPAGTATTVIANVHADADWVKAYLGTVPGSDPTTIIRVDQEPAAEGLLAAVKSFGSTGQRTFVFAAAEATSLVPVRRYLKQTLVLPPEQVAISGYWRGSCV